MSKIAMAIVKATWKSLRLAIRKEWKSLSDEDKQQLRAYAYSMANQMNQAIETNAEEVF